MKKLFDLLLVVFVGIYLAACSNSSSKLYQKLSKDDPGNTTYKGHYKIGKEYKVKDQTYKPAQNIHYDEVGMASWYGGKNGFHGKKTANGDKYNKHMLTAAHPLLPLPSLVKITNLKNNKSLIVMVNDRGPFSKKRIVDVSEKASELLGFKHHGITKVRVQYMHQETQQFLKEIALAPKEGAQVKKQKLVKSAKAKNKCSINCHVKLVNLRHKTDLPENF